MRTDPADSKAAKDSSLANPQSPPKWYRSLQHWAWMATIIACLLGLVKFVWDIRRDVRLMGKNIESVKEEVVRNRFTILYPVNGGAVALIPH